MKRLTLFTFFFGLFYLAFVPNALANGVYFSKIPDGLEKSCNLCHSAVPVLNEFGEKFKANNYQFATATGDKPENPKPKTPDPAAGGGDPQEKPSSSGTGESPAKQDAVIGLILPNGSARGEKTQLQAKVTLDGKPLAGKRVSFAEETEFFGQGRVELGEASTGADGIAMINYWPASTAEKVNLTASIEGDSRVNAGWAAGFLSLTVAGPLYEKAEGLAVPFLGTWAIGLLAGGIWSTYFYAGYKVLGIRKLGKTGEQEAVRGEEEGGRSRARA